MDSTSYMPLDEAVGRWRTSSRWTNAYSWYRAQALQRGRVHFGEVEVEAFKISGRWMVLKADAEAAVAAVERLNERRRDVTDEYNRRRLVVASGRVETNWGSYSVRGQFHRCTWRDPSSPWGTVCWKCNGCFQPVREEHEREECHRCRDWTPCGRDCTLSAIACDDCGTRLAL